MLLIEKEKKLAGAEIFVRSCCSDTAQALYSYLYCARVHDKEENYVLMWQGELEHRGKDGVSMYHTRTKTGK